MGDLAKRYMKFEITDEDIDIKGKRDKFRELEKQIKEIATDDATDEENIKVRTALINEINKYVPYVNTICGDKEVLEMLLNNIDCKTAKELRSYNTIFTKVEEVKHDGWLILTEEQHKWVKENVEKINFAYKVKDDKGNENAFFPAILRRRIADFLDKFEVAANKMPDELKKLELVETPKEGEVK